MQESEGGCSSCMVQRERERERESTVEVRDGRGEKENSVALREVPSYETLMAEMESLKIHLSQTDSPTVLCHNDLLTKNIIYNSFEGTVKFIDYEYADYNYQAFDIGNHFNEFAG
ncbi:Ethanolamine kinase, partial [Ameca splendens]